MAPLTAADAIMTAASQSPLAELTVSVDASFVTSSNVIAYCGAQASRWMRFCERRRAGDVSALIPGTDVLRNCGTGWCPSACGDHSFQSCSVLSRVAMAMAC